MPHQPDVVVSGLGLGESADSIENVYGVLASHFPVAPPILLRPILDSELIVG